MATANTKSSFVPDLEAATERARETNDRLTEVGRKVTNAYLDGVEKYTEGFAEFERKLGQQTHVEAVASMLDTHAQLTEEVVKAGVSAARELIYRQVPIGLVVPRDEADVIATLAACRAAGAPVLSCLHARRLGRAPTPTNAS